MSLASYVEHTLLRPDATPADVERHCEDAARHAHFAVCISPVFVASAKMWLRGTNVQLVTVAGFPHGTEVSEVKAEAARRSVEDGADEVDMVMPLGLARAERWDAVERDVRVVRDAIPRATLKVILETGYFEPEAIRHAAHAAVSGGADFVKTSTGYGPRGATLEDVTVLAAAVGGKAGVKAAGGIRTAAFARLLIGAGASRIGTSNGVALVAEA
ncbi:MAG TPA: deoxyribose-phosphate aldolase [Polyangiaceae bacterium]|jgi:deoxyribose-phosphate aldolase|nr:deoxyribose-phosphate aldolase [Polyangiaceae bacterium]